MVCLTFPRLEFAEKKICYSLNYSIDIHEYITYALPLARMFLARVPSPQHEHLLVLCARPDPDVERMDKLEDGVADWVLQALALKDRITFASCGDVHFHTSHCLLQMPLILEASRLPSTIGGHSYICAFARIAVLVFTCSRINLSSMTNSNALEIADHSRIRAWASPRKDLEAFGLESWKNALQVAYDGEYSSQYCQVVQETIGPPS